MAMAGAGAAEGAPVLNTAERPPKRPPGDSIPNRPPLEDDEDGDDEAEEGVVVIVPLAVCVTVPPARKVNSH
jgi:hypothetical protein